jgi:hypothetical protein
MKLVEKKQILILSDGSIINHKTFIKTANKIKILDKDHKTFLLNKKNKTIEHDSKNLNDFKLKFFKF